MTSRGYRPQNSDERTKVMEAMIEQRIRTSSTWQQVASEHGVCRATVMRWKATDEWRAIENKWRRIMREEARTEIGESIAGAIAVLNELAHDKSVTPFTRMNSAKTLLEFSGVADEIEETKVDQHDEFLDFLKRIDTRPSVAASLIDVEVLPGGLLPPQVASLADVVDAEYTQVESDVDSLEADSPDD